MKSSYHSVSKLLLAALFGLVFAFGLAWQNAAPVYAQGPTLDVSMSFAGGATELTTDAGVEFTYFLSYRCASANSHCYSAVITDTLPPPLQFVDYATTPHVDSVTVNGSTVVFNFVEPLPAGSTGLLEIQAMFPPGTLPGTTAINNATSSTTGGTDTTNDTTATVAPATFDMNLSKTDNGDVDNFVVGSEFSTTYLLQFNTNPGINLINPVVTDTLPAGATYLGSSPAGTYHAGPPATVTWSAAAGQLPMTITVGSNYQIELYVSFPAGTFSPGDSVSNTFSAAGDPEDGSGHTVLSCPGCPNIATLQAPSYGASFNKSAVSASSYQGHNIEERAGQPITYNITYDNNGTITATNVIITDALPASHTVAAISVNPVSDPLNAFYELNNSGTWTAFPGNAYTQSTTVTPANLGVSGSAITGLRWELGSVPYGAVWNGGFNATLSSTLVASTTLTNNADVTAHWDNQGNSTTETDHSSASVHIIDARAIPRPGKTLDSGPYNPGDIIPVSLTASNADVAHNVVSPTIILADLLPEELEIVVSDGVGGYRPALLTDTWYTLVESDGALAPTATITRNYSGTQTLLRWEWDSSYAMQPDHNTEVSFLLRVKQGARPGTYSNRAIMMWGDTTINPLLCHGYDGGDPYTDILDLDNDGNTSDAGCQTAPQPFEVSSFLAMDSEKFVYGELDSGWNKLGWTVPGGYVDWQMIITNTSNVTATNLIVYDILPYIGDTGVIATWETRDSIWRPNMQAPVVVPPGVPLTVYYSQSKNPCRPEVVPSGPSGCVDDWTTTFPGDAASVQALKLDFRDAGGALEMAPADSSGSGGVVTFTWHMVAPNNAPQGAANIAWNSFGFTADELGGSKSLLPAEPIKVGTRLYTTTIPYNLGNYVWLDVYGQQNDGIQQPQETGIDGVRVELWDADTNTLIDYRITGPDYNGNPGYYLFADIPADHYFLRFFTPLTNTLPYTFSIPNQGGDDALDSDGQTPGTDPVFGPYLQTTDFNLNADTMDWDQGLWLPTDYGDADWDGTNWNYPVRASDFAPSNQYLAGRHIISGSLWLGSSVDAELDGVPTATAHGDDLADTPDDEDGVQFDQYLGSVALPTGVMVIGYNHTLNITATVPATRTGYLNAWIDWNRDGDWDDAGEQIATDRTNTGTYNLNVAVPAGASPGTTYARFRYSLESSLTPTGTAASGEVEDYRIELIEEPVKSIVSTSEAHTTGSNLAVGEIVRYRLTAYIPEGVMPNFVITDHLPAGLQFLDDGTTTVSFTGTNIISTSFTITGGPFGDGTDPVFNFGTLTNGDNGATDGDAVVIEFNAQVSNIATNNHGNIRDNNFTVSYDTFSADSNVVSVQIVEPQVTIAKNVATTPTDAGDTVVYNLLVSGSRQNAFDLVISDTLDANLTLNSVSVNAPAYAVITNTSAAPLVDVRLSELRPGDTATVIVTATVNAAAPAGQNIPNTADLTYTSLPGSHGTVPNPTGSVPSGVSGASDGERNGSAIPTYNDYHDTDNAPVNLGVPAMEKTVSPLNYTIGQEITYTLRITLPEGTTPDLVVEDNLPAGLEYVRNQIITTAAASNGDLANDFNGALPVPTITPTTGSGGGVMVDFGNTLTTDDNNPANNTFLIRVVALVLNEMGNQNGDTLNNIADLRYTRNGATETLSDNTDINLIEPVLAIDKHLTTPIPSPMDAGTVITYEIVLRHHTASTADAFDVVLTDTLPASGLTNHTLLGTAASGMTDPGASLTGNALRVPAAGSFDMPQGAVFTATVQATIDTTVVPGQIITNTAGVVWSSLDGTPPHERDGGSSEPDGSEFWNNPPNYLDDYETVDSAALSIDGSNLDKALVTTSAPHTTGSNVTIGEVVTYSIRVILPEGSIPSLVITDNIPVGLDYTGNYAVDDSAFNGTLPALTVTDTGGSGGDVIFSYGSFTVPNDNDPANNVFTITLGALVLDEAGNAGLPGSQTALTNIATVQVGSGAPTDSNPVTVDVVEPQMLITKTIATPLGGNQVGAGDTITITLAAQNTGLSTAFDVIVEDPLPNSLFIAFAEESTPAGFTYSANNTGANTIIRYTGGNIAVGQTLYFTFTAQVTTTPQADGLVHTNVATVTQSTTLSSTHPNEGNERDEPDVSDDDSITFRSLSLGNLLWFDTGAAAGHTNNGMFDADENGVGSGVTLNLYFDADGSGDISAGDPLTQTTVTDANGRYLFTRLAAGNYIVQIPAGQFAAGQPLDGYWSSTITDTDPDNDADEDVDENGVDDANPAANGIASMPVTLYYNSEPLGETNESGGTDNDPNANRTVDFGFFQPVAIGNVLWFDDGGATGVPDNGQMDGDESDVGAGVEVQLFSNTGPTLVMTTTTDANGRYEFDMLTPGAYYVHIPASQFGAAGPLRGYVSSSGNGADEATNETGDENGIDDPDPAVNGISSTVFNLQPGTEITGEPQPNYSGYLPDANVNFTDDFGFVEGVALGNIVWIDDGAGAGGVADNGIMDGAEAGVDNVTVQLFTSTQTIADTPIRTTTTSGGGFYQFDNLNPGQYFVHIPGAEFNTGGDLETYVSSAGAGTDEDTDHLAPNGDENGIDEADLITNGVRTMVYDLQPNTETTTDDETNYTGLLDDNNVNFTADFGFVNGVALGNIVWIDEGAGANTNNGVFDGDENGVSGLTVQLFTSTQTTADTPVRSTTTDANGRYYFDNLNPGSYFVHIPASQFTGTGVLTGYVSSTGAGTSDSADHDTDENGLDDPTPAANGISTQVYTLTVITPMVTGEDDTDYPGRIPDASNNFTADFGFVSMVALGNIVWIDDGNGGGIADNGIMDGGEAGVDGVTMELYRSGDVPGVDTPLLTTLTGGGGFYYFDNLHPGQYFVHIPASEFTGTQELRGYVSSSGNGADETSNEDVDENGIDDPDPAANGISSTVFDLQPNSEQTGEDQSNYTGSLDDNNVNFTDDFGFVEAVAIGNIVWIDDGNGGGIADNGIMDGGEAGIDGVTMELYRSGDVPGVDTPLLTTLTGGGGFYQFDNLHPGQYFVHIPASEFTGTQELRGYVSSSGNGADEATNETGDENGIDDPDPAVNGISSTVFNLQPNSEATFEDQSNYTGNLDDDNVNFTDDFGFVEAVAIGNIVWIDDGAGTPANADNGQMDAGETGVDNVTIQLFTSTQTIADTPIRTTTTSGGGFYQFDNLNPGGYFVHIPGAEFNTGGDLETYVSSAGAGTDEDTDHLAPNGDENGIDEADLITNGVRTMVYDLQPNTETTTDDETNYTGLLDNNNVNFTADFGFVNGVALGNIVWFDTGAAANTNNGVFDGDENGVSGLTVQLFTSTQTTADTPVRTTTTDANGRYYFDNLNPGSYFVHIPASQFTGTGVLTGYVSSAPTGNDEVTDHTGDENGINDPDPAANGISTQVYTLTVGGEITLEDDTDYPGRIPDASNNFTADFGFVQSVALGNLVWFDTGAGAGETNNGVFDTGESVASGVSVQLFHSGDDPNTDPALLTTVTDASGRYYFDNLAPGDYFVHIPASQFQSGGALENYVSSTGAGNNDDDHTDDENGIDTFTPAADGVSSQVYTLSIGDEPQSEDAANYTGSTPDANANFTADFGFVNGVALGNIVWIDNGVGGGTPNDGILNGAEAPVVGVRVELYTSTQTIGTSTVFTLTDANGRYYFDNLAQGAYFVHIPASQFGVGQPLEGYFSTTGAGTSDGDDHDTDENGIDNADPATNGISTMVYTLTAAMVQGEDDTNYPGSLPDAQTNFTADFGFLRFDWGDLPDTPYPTLSASNGAYHVIDDVTFLGASVDPESNGQPAADAKGDDNAAAPDDEDGVTFLSPVIANHQVTMTVIAGGNGYLSAWIDFNADGTLDAINLVEVDGVAAGGTLNDLNLSAGAHSIVFSAPANTAISQTIYSRFRFSAGAGEVSGPTGMAPSGEVEDYALVSLGDVVWYDPDRDGVQDGAPAEPGIPGVALNLLDSSGAPVTDAQGNPVATVTDANGNYYFGGLPEGGYIVEVDAGNWNPGQVFGNGGAYQGATGSPGQGGDDQNNTDDNGDNDGATGAARSVPITLSAGTEPVTDGDSSANSDLSIDFGFSVGIDRGDLPDVYGTLNASAGPSHLIDGVTFLGATVDAEGDGQPSISADGDDNNGVTPDDEDGVTFNTPIMPGQAYTLTVQAGGAGYLNAWIDFNGDGDFADAGEQIFNEENLTPGAHIYSFTAPATISDTLYSRFRYTISSTQAITPNGFAPSGEVEDYALMSLGNTVWLDNGAGGGNANNRFQDGAEAGISGVSVELYLSSQTPGTDTPIAVTTTDANGHYLFTGLAPDDYVVHVPASQFQAGGALQDHQSSTGSIDPDDDVDLDDNGNDPAAPANYPVDGVSADPVTLSLGNEPDTVVDGNGVQSNLTVDFGFYRPVAIGNVVWFDTGAGANTNNGVFDGDESGASGVEVQLFHSTDVPGMTPPLLTATTTVSGYYQFDNLTPGDYFVYIPPTQFQSGGALEDYTSSLGAGSTETDDQDIDENGVDNFTPETSGIASMVYTLQPGTEPVSEISQPTYTGVLPDDSVNFTADFGFVPAASLGDFVWYDNDRDGVQDFGEPGVENVTVVLYNAANTPVFTTATNGTGYYLFDNLTPGDYHVRFIPPASYTITLQDQGADDALDSDANPATGETIVTTLDPGEHDPTWDAGIYRDGALASIGDTVWYDDNHDGIQDAGESGVAGVEVRLYGPLGNVISTTATNGSGYYEFTNLNPGDYFVEFILPAGYTISPQDQGADDALDSDADPTTGRTIITTLDPDEHDPTWDMGIYSTQPLASIGDTVWYDADRDGVQDIGESGVDAVTVNLYDGAGNPVDTTATNGSGYYEFTNLIPGDYFVEFVPPAGYAISPQDTGIDDAADSDADPANGRTIVTTLDPDEHDPTWDMGIYQVAAIGDTVWFDDNQDGIQDAGESGVGNVTVVLYNVSGTPVATTTTNSSGFYQFTNLVPGDYHVKFYPPAGFTVSPQDQGTDDALDSDADPTTGETIVTTLDPGENDPTWDMGIYSAQPLAAIGDTVWYDDNRDGVQDAGESGVDAVTVNLYDGAGSFVAATATNGSGFYQFTNLVPGDYFVEFIPPAGYTLSPQDQGADDALDSDANPADGRTIVTTLDPGENDPDWDAGIYQVASIGDTVWFDDNQDGIQDAGESGVGNVTVVLYNISGTPVATTTTNSSGFYQFTNLTPGDYHVRFIPPAGFTISPIDQGGNDAVDSDANPATGETIVTTLDPGENDPTWDAGIYSAQALASIGDYVWFDSNHNGVQDGGEAPVFGVTVNLYDGAGNFVDAAATDTNGSYLFDNLVPGDYFVEFVPPAGYILTGQDAGTDDALDSDADLNTGRTIVTTLDPGEHDPTWDAGLYQLAAIGDTVWYDNNRDGIQDAGESGVSSVTVELLDGSGSVVSTTVTNGSGYYDFTDLTPGDYSLRFTPPAGYTISPIDQGGDDARDSDANPADGETVVTTLTPGENDPTWDMGIYQAAAIVVDKQVSLARVAPNQQVTYTIRITNTGNATLNPVLVTDTMDAGLTYVVGSANPPETAVNGQTLTWADATGGAGLAPGASMAITLLADVSQSIGVYNNNVTVEGIAPTGPVTDTDSVPLFVEDPSVAVDKNVTAPGVVGDLITFTIRITNTGPSTLDQIPLFDHFVGDVEYVGGFPQPDAITYTTTGDPGGVMVWNDLTLPGSHGFGRNLQPDEVFVVTTTFRLRDAHNLTMTNVASVSQVIDEDGNDGDGDDALTAVDLLYFTAKQQQNQGILLRWRTQMEQDNYGFRLLRSTTGSLDDAAEIAFIPGQGQGNSGGGEYSYLDTDVQRNQSYAYWMVDIDLNGTETYHGPETITFAHIRTIFLPIVMR